MPVSSNSALKKTLWATVAVLGIGPQAALAAPCCGGHAAIPSLITGYEQYRVNAALTGSRLIGDAPESGLPVFRDLENQTTTSRWALSGSYVFHERFQLGAGTSLGAFDGASGSALGDTDLIGAWEAVPRPSLLSAAPQIHMFAQMTLPTGKSIYETSNSKEVTGAGFYKFHLGTVATTTVRKWDAYGIARASYGLSREFSEKRVTVSPGLGGDISLGLGYSITGEWRVGASIQSVFSEGKRIDSQASGGSVTSSSVVWPTQAQLTWFKDQNNTFTVSYLDETLIGPVHNTSLSRSVSFQYTYRFANVD